MCEPTTLLMAGSAALNAYGQVKEGRAQQRAANAEAAQLEYEAATAEDDAQLQAQRIRRAGRRARGEMVASIGASGTKIGEWSSLDLERELLTDTETDARMAILTGTREARSLRTGARNARSAGRGARKASLYGAATSLLQAGSTGYRMGMFKGST